MLKVLTEHILKEPKIRMMDFNPERPDLKTILLNGVLFESSYEARIFKRNIKVIYDKIIEELGYDPRELGIPEHILNQLE